MKIMSFNTQHCRNYIAGKIDYPIMADAILRCQADIVGLNEMRDAGVSDGFEPQVQNLSELTGLKNYYFAKAIDVGENNPYGNGLLSAYPFVSVETIPVPDPIEKNGPEFYETRCLLKAVLENGVTVLVIHFGLNEDEQVNAVNTILQHITKEKCVLMGDFNALPDAPVLKPLYEKLNDTAAYFDGEKLSFPSDVPDRKIDYIFVSKDLTVVSADIPDIVASDHRPHTAEIEF